MRRPGPRPDAPPVRNTGDARAAERPDAPRPVRGRCFPRRGERRPENHPSPLTPHPSPLTPPALDPSLTVGAHRAHVPRSPVLLYHTDTFALPLPPGHRFPMAKYTRLRERVAAWLDQHPRPGVELKLPPAATDAQLLRAHTPDYLERITTGGLTREEVNRLGFPWSEALVERSRRSVGATIAACTDAVRGLGADRPFAANLAGGTHHAFADRGEGFCLFNDAVAAARDLRARGLVENVAVIDCDVHQGNGTAKLCEHDPRTFTLSLHGARNYPGKKERSDLDVPLPDGTGDAAYLEALNAALAELGRRFSPDLVIYVAGADPYEHDRLGRLSLTAAGLLDRDRAVYRWAKGRGAPVAAVMAGGYAPDVDAIAGIHFATIRAGVEELCS